MLTELEDITISRIFNIFPPKLNRYFHGDMLYRLDSLLYYFPEFNQQTSFFFLLFLANKYKEKNHIISVLTFH